MTNTSLKIIADAMNEMGIRYGFVSYNEKPLRYPYFVGEYTETASINEDGVTDAQFTLNGYSRTTWEALEDIKEQIQRYFGSVSGKTVIAENGNGVAVWYEGAFIVPTWEEDLKRMQINLHVREWRVI